MKKDADLENKIVDIVKKSIEPIIKKELRDFATFTKSTKERLDIEIKGFSDIVKNSHTSISLLFEEKLKDLSLMNVANAIERKSLLSSELRRVKGRLEKDKLQLRELEERLSNYEE